jgi:DNA-binding NarL/FixJ family response regulator
LRDSGHPRGTVLVVDDEESVGGFARRHFPHWTVTQAFSLEAAAAELAAVPDVRLVLLDLNLTDTTYPEPLRDNPFQGSFDLARHIRRTRPALPVVIFSAHINGAIVNAAHVAGAELVSKDDPAASLDLLCRRLDLAHQVGTWQPRPYLTWLREQRGLTPREAEVASLVLQGTTRYADLGDHLGISPNTVKRHVSSLLDRAGVDSLLDFIFRARTVDR